MISVLVYIIKLLLNFFVTTILVTDVTSEQKDDSKNLKLIIFCSFFTLTLTSAVQYFSSDNVVFMIGLALFVSFYVISNLVKDFNLDEKLKVFLVSLCSFLFGVGGFVVTFIALISAVISYIILYNSTDFYKFFFTRKDDHESDSSIIDENETA